MYEYIELKYSFNLKENGKSNVYAYAYITHTPY